MIEQFILSVPTPVWVLIGGIIGWFIGDLIKKSIHHEVRKEAVGTILKVVHGDGSVDMLLEWDTFNYFNNLKTDHPVIFNVKVEKRD